MISIVIPTVGRDSLDALLERLPRDGAEIVVVDDRRVADPPLRTPPYVRVIRGPSRGPAAARNAGWRSCTGDWIVFLDDDVVPSRTWWFDLLADLEVDAPVAGVKARIIVVPEALTDWARNTAGLAGAAWITADMAYRRDALELVRGFDERFPRAYREDSDIAYRIRSQGGALVAGSRVTVHPVRPESPWISLRTQRGNADDALLRRIYGSDWHALLGIPYGRRRLHAVTTAAGLAAVVLRSRLAALAWLGLTAQFAWSRKRNAPDEPIVPLIVTSVLIPPLAVAHYVRGLLFRDK